MRWGIDTFYLGSDQAVARVILHSLLIKNIIFTLSEDMSSGRGGNTLTQAPGEDMRQPCNVFFYRP